MTWAITGAFVARPALSKYIVVLYKKSSWRPLVPLLILIVIVTAKLTMLKAQIKQFIVEWKHEMLQKTKLRNNIITFKYVFLTEANVI